jgi:hypothetical protein
VVYNKFTLSDLSDKFQITYELARFLPELTDIGASKKLLMDLEEAAELPLSTEKAKSELIIVPLLKELHRTNKNKFSYFSGYQFNVDSKKGLKGYCDFILSAQPKKIEIESPVFCLVEAKKDNIEDGYAQCGAEMYAAQLFNQKHHTEQKAIYGCVTNAFCWVFLKLEQNTLIIDHQYVPLTFTQPDKVLAILQWILNQCLIKQLKKS